MKLPKSWLRNNQPVWIDLLVLVILGLSIRLLFLGSKSLWLDEANSLRVALLGQEALWTGQSESYHPPLFYWLLAWWSQFGRSEFMLRLLAVIPATLSIPALYFLAKDWFGEDVARSSAALMLFSPLLVWYAQECRPYALLSLLGLLIITAVTKLLQQPRVGWWLIFVAGMAAAFYLHYFALLLIPFQVLLFVVWLAEKRGNGRAFAYWLIGLICAVAAWWPWLQTPAFDRFWHVALSDRNYIVALIASRWGVSIDLGVILAVFVVACVLGATAVWHYLDKIPRFMTYLRALSEKKWLHWLAGGLFLLLLVISVIPRGHSFKRQIVLWWPFVLLGFGWLWPWRSRHRNWLGSFIILSLLAALVNILAFPKPQWREVNAVLVQQQQGNDIVLLEPSYMIIPFDYYNSDQSNRVGLPFGAEPEKMTAILQEHERIWLIIHQADADPQQRNATWLDEQATLVNSIDFYRLQIRLYESPGDSP